MSATEPVSVQDVDEFLAKRVAERDVATAAECWADVVEIDAAIDIALAARFELAPVKR